MTCTREKLKPNDGKNCGYCGFPVGKTGHCGIGSCPNWSHRCEVHKR